MLHHELPSWLQSALHAAQCPEPEVESRWILEAVGLGRLQLFQRSRDPVSTEVQARLAAILARRQQREPLQYILGEAAFRQLNLIVTPDVLIPRPETEELVSLAIDCLQKMPTPHPRVVDIGTGSGAIALALKQEQPQCEVWASDLSEAALAIAQQNGARYQLEIQWRSGDLLTPFLEHDPALSFDLIVSNPPYIPQDNLPRLAPEVQGFEPLMALSPGPNALHCYQRFAQQAPQILVAGGWLIAELEHDLAEATAALFHSPAWQSVQLIKDLQGQDRFIQAQRKALS